MRTVILCVLSLIIGVTIGWCFEHNRAAREKDSAVELMTASAESSDGHHVARAIKTIVLIDSGNAEGAVESLSKPIADYYERYGPYSGGNTHRAELRALIEELARTNKTVARVIMVNATHSPNK